MIDAAPGKLISFAADPACDSVAIYEAAGARGASVIVTPTRTASVARYRPRSTAHDRTTERVRKIGRRRWKKESGYHRQGTVENIFFRYKSVIGGRLKARHPSGQMTEALLACSILNRGRNCVWADTVW